MSAGDSRSPAAYERALEEYLFERSEEARAVRVGEKEHSEQAAIVERYAALFTRERLAALREAEEAAPQEERERLYRLRKTCEGGLVSAALVEQADALENALLAARVSFRDEHLPLRSAQARLAVLETYGEREELGELVGEASAAFNDERLELLRAGESLEAEVSGEPDPVARNEEEKGISLRDLERVLDEANTAVEEAWTRLRHRWLDRLLGPEREDEPSSSHVAYLRRLSPLASIYTRERSVEVCLETLGRLGFDLGKSSTIRLDVDDRPQKSPRACVIASRPPQVVHLITRAQGGLHDYGAFLHEAGHALHYAGCDPSLPYTFRKLSRDHALTEVYSYIVEAISREPGWHAQHFGLSDEEAATNAEATVFLEALLFRRYAAKLGFELELWSHLDRADVSDERYAGRLRAAIGVRYRPDNVLADMDAGFYSADYLRAWIRSAQLRASLVQEIGEDWWRSPETGERLRALFAEGTRPSSEDLARRLRFEPLDTGPLVSELTA
ncbi:MAG: hypothetical protein H0V40_13150 [Actinobacteria bacterium]|nr:hypothetical protein [Actinomycetota bacterium]